MAVDGFGACSVTAAEDCVFVGSADTGVAAMTGVVSALYSQFHAHLTSPLHRRYVFFTAKGCELHTRHNHDSNGGCLVGATVAAVLTTAPAAYKMHGGTGDKDCVLDITGKLSGSPKEFVQGLGLNGVKGKKK